MYDFIFECTNSMAGAPIHRSSYTQNNCFQLTTKKILTGRRTHTWIFYCKVANCILVYSEDLRMNGDSSIESKFKFFVIEFLCDVYLCLYFSAVIFLQYAYEFVCARWRCFLYYLPFKSIFRCGGEYIVGIINFYWWHFLYVNKFFSSSLPRTTRFYFFFRILFYF